MSSLAAIRKRNPRFLFLFLGLAIAACSPAARQVFFDVPPEPPSGEAIAAERDVSGELPVTPVAAVEEQALPAVEEAKTWDGAKAQLPQHAMGGVDWSEAVRQGLVRPRPPVGAAPDVQRSFELDFFMPGPTAKMDAWFPHSAHTQWLACDNCHGGIYRYRENEFKMADLYAGKSCGTCHGKVAFPVTQCKRCHLDM